MMSTLATPRGYPDVVLIGGPSFWFHELGGLPPRRPALAGPLTCDVAIVGAGYTGLWTAYYLKRAQPDLHVVVLEREVAGYGASGRNGGWVAGEVSIFHDDATTAAIRATVDEIGEVVAAERIACAFHKGGALAVATSELQLGRLRDHPLARGAAFLDAEALAERVRIAGATGAVFDPHVARVQPAALARGLADAVERLGVPIYEGTDVTRIDPGAAQTIAGTVRARWIVRATEGYTPSLPGLGRTLIPLRSTIIVTEPLPDHAWAEVGWDGAETIADAALSYAYVQRTADGRIAIGGRGRPYYWRSGHDAHGEVEAWAVRRLTGKLHELWPAARGVRIAHAWSGVFAAQRDWAPTVAADPSTGLAWAGGWVGEGVAAANLGGRILCDLIGGVPSDLTALPMVNRRQPRRWEPEPLRMIGTHLVYDLVDRADAAEQRTGRASRLYPIAKLISGREAE
jgi:glycine/D-amino acid oxidase-like deaminating enzyme